MAASLTYPARIAKSPTDDRDFYVDFEAFEELTDGGQTIASGTVGASVPAGLTIGAAYVSGSRVYAPIAGGTAGTTYTVRFSATRSNGRVLSRNLILDVKDI